MRSLTVIVLAACVAILVGQLRAIGAPKVKPVEAQIEALTQALCFHIQESNVGTGGGLGVRHPITAKACRDAPHIVFVSSESFSGAAIGGVPRIAGVPRGANRRCQELAANAGLPGFYRAWLTGESNPDLNPPAFRFVHSFGPYVLVDGTVVADDFQGLTSGALLAPINLDENGDVADVEVWTNVATDGTRVESTDENTCDNFRDGTAASSGVFGISTETGSSWTNAGLDTCDQPKALYCFGQ